MVRKGNGKMGKKKGLQRLLTVILLVAFLVTLTSGVLAEEISSTKPEAQAAETVETQPVETEAETTAAETTAVETTPAETTAAETTPAETTAVETTPAETTAAETTAAETAPVELAGQELTAAIYTDGNYETLLSDTEDYDGTTITLNGIVPVGATVKAYPVSVQIDEFTVYAAYDITIFDADGSKYEPDAAANGTINVSIDTPALESVEEADVYHIKTADVPETETLPEPSDAETVEATVIDPTDTEAAPQTVTAEKVDTVETKDTAKAEFDAESFSIYVVGHESQTSYTVEAGTAVTLNLTTSKTNSFWEPVEAWNGTYWVKATSHSWTADSGLTFTGTGNTTGTTALVSVPATLAVGTYQVTHTYDFTGYHYPDYTGSASETFTITVAAPASLVSINDTILSNGLLNGVLKDSSGNTVTGDALNSYTFTWMKNGAAITPADNVSGVWFPNSGRSVNVAYVGGAEETNSTAAGTVTNAVYTLTVTDTATGDTLGTATDTVTYGSDLMNGSFERPAASGAGNFFQNGTSDLIWKTTASKGTTELSSRSGVGSYGLDAPADGEQFAELNAEEAGAMYQDVLTVPNTTLHWGLQHQARNYGVNAFDDSTTIDTMYVVMMASSASQSLTTQSNLQAYITNMIKATAGLSAYNYNANATANGSTLYQGSGVYAGVTIVKISDDAANWHSYNSIANGSDYTVPEGQYATRFFFVAGAVASYDSTVGNVLDQVYFTTNLPYTIEYYVKNSAGTYVKQTETDSGTVTMDSTLVNAASKNKFQTLSAAYTLVQSKIGSGTADSGYTDYGTTTSWNVINGQTVMRLYFIPKTTSLTVHKNFAGLTAGDIPAGGLTVTFTLDGQSTTAQTITVTPAAFDASTDYTVTFTGISMGSHTVKETCSLSGYQITTTVGAASNPTTAYNSASGYTVSISNTTPVSAYFKNTYAKNHVQDATNITVRKTFTGLSADQFTALVTDNVLTLTVTGPGESETAYTLKLGTGSSSNVTKSIDTYTQTVVWTISGLKAGTYHVAESNAEVADLRLTATGFGSVTTATPTITFSGDFTNNGNTKTFDTTPATDTELPLVIASLSGEGGWYFVWTPTPLSSGERTAVVNGEFGKNLSNWSLDHIQFFSGTDTMTYRSGKVACTYNSTTKVYTLSFDASQQWNKFWNGTYTITGSSADIDVTNSYGLNTADLTIKKVDEDGKVLTGAKFQLYIKRIDDTYTPSGSEIDMTGESEITVTGLANGEYYLVETRAPSGYSLSTAQIFFTVTNGAITGTDISGLATFSSGTVTVTNYAGYSLPRTGGMGTTVFRVVGIVILVAAAAALVAYLTRGKRKKLASTKHKPS